MPSFDVPRQKREGDACAVYRCIIKRVRQRPPHDCWAMTTIPKRVKSVIKHYSFARVCPSQQSSSPPLAQNSCSPVSGSAYSPVRCLSHSALSCVHPLCLIGSDCQRWVVSLRRLGFPHYCLRIWRTSCASSAVPLARHAIRRLQIDPPPAPCQKTLANFEKTLVTAEKMSVLDPGKMVGGCKHSSCGVSRSSGVLVPRKLGLEIAQICRMICDMNRKTRAIC